MTNIQTQNDTIYPLQHLYFQGLSISAASATLVSIAPGAARDSSNNVDMIVGLQNYAGLDNPALQFNDYQQGLLINSAMIGVNGLDYGSIAANSSYAVYLIGDSRNYKNTAGLLSLTSNVAPTLPAGYDSYRFIGFIETDGSSHFVASNGAQNISGLLQYYNSPAINVLDGGNDTTFTAIDLTAGNAIPATILPNIIVNLLVDFTPSSKGNTVKFRPTGSSSTVNLPLIVGEVAGEPQNQYIQVIAGVGASKPEIDYIVTSSSDSVSVLVASWGSLSVSSYGGSPVVVEGNTVANNIAVFSNATGSIKEPDGDAITPFGVVSSSPTSNNGSLKMKAANAGGNFTTTISNGTMGQSTVYTLPDIGASTGGIVVSPSGFKMKSVAQAAIVGDSVVNVINDSFCTLNSMVLASFQDTGNVGVVLLKAEAASGQVIIVTDVDPGLSHVNYLIVNS